MAIASQQSEKIASDSEKPGQMEETKQEEPEPVVSTPVNPVSQDEQSRQDAELAILLSQQWDAEDGQGVYQDQPQEQSY